MLKNMLNNKSSRFIASIIIIVILFSGCSRNEVSRIKLTNNDLTLNIKITNDDFIYFVSLMEIIKDKYNSDSESLKLVFETKRLNIESVKKNENIIKIQFDELERIQPNLNIQFFNNKEYRIIAKSHGSVTLTDFKILSINEEDVEIKIIKNESFIHMR